jgi:hypothetical protein
MDTLWKAARVCAVGAAWCALSLVVGCAEEQSQEAARVSLPVEVGVGELGAVTSDLGFEVELQELRVAARDLEFTVEGEVHEAARTRGGRPWWEGLERVLVSQAWAHPGHYAGGAVTGELPGRFVLDWTGQEGGALGEASLLAGDYTGANFTFARGAQGDGLGEGDPLLGHSALLRGEARKDGLRYPFVVVVDQDEDRQVVGLPFELRVGPGTQAALWVRFSPQDPTSSATIFDGIAFDALAQDAGGVIQLAPDSGEAYNRLRRTLQTHSFYRVEAQ